MSKLYESFHRTTKKQKRIIKENDFTFIEILSIIRELTGDKRKRILDIGCGTGSLDFYLASKGHYVTGIDISNRAIQACKRDAKSLGVNRFSRFTRGDIESKSFSNKFDIVLCLEVIEHLKADKKAAKKMHSLLGNRKTLILSTPSKNAPLYKLGLLNRFDKRVGHLRRYSPEEIKEKLKDAGFKIIKLKKTEGIVRNFLFTFSIGGLFLKIINRFSLGKLVQKIDNLFLGLFGESDLILVAKKL